MNERNTMTLLEELDVYDVKESSTAGDRVRFEFDIPTFLDGEYKKEYLEKLIVQKKIELEALEGLLEKTEPAVDATTETPDKIQLWVNDFGPGVDVGA